MWKWRQRTDEDFGEEIRANIALEINRFVAEGMSPENARAAALRAFGSVAQAQERFYESRRVMWLDDAAAISDTRSARSREPLGSQPSPSSRWRSVSA